jgi:hypothetical protein
MPSELGPALILVQLCLLKKPSARPTGSYTAGFQFLLTAAVFLLDLTAILKTAMNGENLTVQTALDIAAYSTLAFQVIDQRVFFSSSGYLLQELLNYFEGKINKDLVKKSLF